MASSTNIKTVVTCINKNLNGLRNIGEYSDEKYKFKILSEPFTARDEDAPPPPANQWIIIGFIYPLNTNIYNGQPIRIQITLREDFPLVAPEVRLLQNVYHPNVSEKDGRVCLSKIFSGSEYKPSMTLAEVVTEVSQILDTPSTDLVENTEAALLYANDIQQYEAKAKHTFFSKT